MQKNLLLLLLLLINLTTAAAQNQRHKAVVDRFVSDFNDSDFETIYKSFSARMQNSKPKKYFFDIFSRVRTQDGRILSLDLLSYRENSLNRSQAKYNAHCETGNISIKITIDDQGQIIGLYIKKAIYM